MIAPSRHPLTPRQGSALLITLLTTSLLLVLVLTFVVVVRVELRKVVTHQEGLQARANARLGAELAVARLQETLGADTRVSATADLFRQGGGNLHQPTLASRDGNRFWTGAWDSRSWDERNPENKRFLGWLVSGNAQNQTLVNQPPSPDNTARLVGPGSVNQAGDEIRAPRVGVGTAGAYAFWVGDEGVKARFNLDDAHRNAATREERQFRLQSAQRHAAEMLRLPGPGLSLADAGRFPLDSSEFRQRRERLLSGAQLTYLGWDENSQADFAALQSGRFHDISLVSAGLFTNTREGGLKRDLSLAFEMPLADFLAHDFFGSGSPLAEPMAYWPGAADRRPPLVPVFRLEGDDLREALLGRFPENGPEFGRNPRRTEAPAIRSTPWQLLRNFYRLYLPADPDRAFYGFPTEISREIGGRRYFTGQSQWPNAQMWALGRRYGQDVNAWTYAEDYGPDGVNYSESKPLGRPILPGIAPVITRIQIVFSVRTQPIPGSPGFYRADLFLDPIVTLMNPYDVPIRTGPAAAQSLDISLEFLQTRFQTRLNGRQSGVRTDFDRVLADAATALGVPEVHHYRREFDEVFQMRLNVGSELLMQPGEVVVFSGRRESPTPYLRTASGRNSPSGVTLELIPGIQAFLPEESGIQLPDAFRDQINWFTNPENPERDARRTERGAVRELMAGDQISFRVDRTERQFRISSGSERYPVVLDRLPFFDGLEGPMQNFNTPFVADIRVDLPAIREEKRPFAVMDWYMKPAHDPFPVFMMDHFNLRASALETGRFGGFHTGIYDGIGRDDMVEVTRHATTDLNPIGAWLAFTGRNGFWGPTNTTAGLTRVPLFSLPRQPLQSLAGFQQLMLRQMGDDPGLIIGNSRLPLFGAAGQKIVLQDMQSNVFDRDKLPGQSGRFPARRLQADMTRPDWSYLYNEALWDGFFFSTLTSRTSLEAFVAGESLPNGTLRPKNAGEAASQLFSGNTIRPEAPDRAAAHLTREGAFNVNATSVEAWRALLASTRDLSLDVEDRPLPRDITGTVFTRSILPADAENAVWTGFRSLSDAQIDLLAQNIVNEVRIRGPFLNLADFVNRRLAPDNHPSRRSGTLQSAIDATRTATAALRINPETAGFFDRTLRSIGRTDLTVFTEWGRPRIAEELDHPLLANLPGYLNQADVLTVIGPLLSARSDTFTVRAFGEHGGARAWCEITVQRIPDFVEDSVDAWAPPEAAGLINQRFGRRFVVTAFRWLGEEDV